MSPGRASPRRLLAILAVAALAFAMSQTLIVPAIPIIGRRYGASPETATWVLTAFLLAASVSTPLAGRLGDMFGKGRTLLVVLGIFTLGSVVSALGGSIAGLIAGRALQGLGGAVLPLAYGIVRDELPPARVAPAIGLISALLGTGSGLGVVMSGVYVDRLSLPWIFWTAAAVSGAAAWAAWRYVPPGRPQRTVRLDWTGAGLLSFGLVAVLLAISQGNRWGWLSPRILALFATGALVLAFFARFELGRRDPVVDMRMLAERAVWSVNLAAFATGFAVFGGLIVVPQLVVLPASTGVGFGATATVAGLVMLPASVAMLGAGPVSGWLGERHGSRLPLAVGAAFAAVAYAGLAALHAELWQIALGTALTGIGIAAGLAALGNLTVTAVRPDQTGAAAGINNLMRTLGGALGAQIAAALLAASAAAGTGLPREAGFAWAFALSSAAATVALVSVALIPRRARSSAAHEAAPSPPAAS